MSINKSDLESLFGPYSEGELSEFTFDDSLQMFVGHVVKREFRGVEIAERHTRIWNLIRDKFGKEAEKVSIVFAFSPGEWEEVGADAA